LIEVIEVTLFVLTWVTPRVLPGGRHVTGHFGAACGSRSQGTRRRWSMPQCWRLLAVIADGIWMRGPKRRS